MLDFTHDPRAFRRGLVIDKSLGNILKVDRHKYCRVAHHGLAALSSAERKRTYAGDGVDGRVPQYTGERFVNLDSLFQLVDATIYSQLVDLMDRRAAAAGEDAPARSYAQMYKDVRRAVDMCHRDGVIKDRVADDPGAYIKRDPELVPMLERFRASGKKCFLLTNSYWEFTNVVMNHLTGAAGSDDRAWMTLFDVVVVGGGKPAFINDERREMFRVRTETNAGLLETCDVGRLASTPGAFEPGRDHVFHGGAWPALHELLGLRSGGQVLYVGDHIFSDILRSKRSLGWRTCLIIPELEPELATAANRATAEARARVLSLRARLRALDREIDALLAAAVGVSLPLCAADDDACDPQTTVMGGFDFSAERDATPALADARARLAEVKDALSLEQRAYHQMFHSPWGQMFKTGYQDSRFAKQVSDYACIYTSQASNLLACSSERVFRTIDDTRAHDEGLDSLLSE